MHSMITYASLERSTIGSRASRLSKPGLGLGTVMTELETVL